MKNDYSSLISLICPTCASDQFEFDSDKQKEEREYSCPDCGEVFSHNDIMDANSERISNAVEDIGNEVFADATKDLQKAFRNFGK